MAKAPFSPPGDEKRVIPELRNLHDKLSEVKKVPKASGVTSTPTAAEFNNLVAKFNQLRDKIVSVTQRREPR